MILALLGWLLATQPARPFADERLLLDRRLEALRRVLPDSPSSAADVAMVREMGQASGLTQLSIEPRSPVESGTQAETILQLTALGGYEELFRFFQKLSLSHRLVDVEKLTVTATLENVCQLETVLRLPYWPARAAVPLPPESARATPAGVPRPALDAFRRDLGLAYAKSEVIAARRRSRRTPRLFLSELAAATRERPVTLAFAALSGEDFTLRGITLGEGPLRALEQRLERGFFRLSDFLIARQGACHTFEVHGRSPVAGPDAELPLPVSDPFEQDAAGCRVDRDAGEPAIVRGRTPTAKDPGQGPLTLRLRGVDVADVFAVLAQLGFGGYVVDEAVGGRASVEITRATLDETLALVRKAIGLEVAEVGPVRRVMRARAAARREAPPGGALSTFQLKRADARDLLAAMAEIDPALASLGPGGFLGRVSVFTTNVPLLAVRAAVLDALSLSERTEEDHRVLDRRSGEAVAPIARSGPESRLVLRREDITVREFDLAGVASGGERFLAFAYSPTGQLHAYAPGSALADAVVRSVDVDGVVLETEEGLLRLSLPPIRN